MSALTVEHLAKLLNEISDEVASRWLAEAQANPDVARGSGRLETIRAELLLPRLGDAPSTGKPVWCLEHRKVIRDGVCPLCPSVDTPPSEPMLRAYLLEIFGAAGDWRKMSDGQLAAWFGLELAERLGGVTFDADGKLEDAPLEPIVLHKFLCPSCGASLGQWVGGGDLWEHPHVEEGAASRARAPGEEQP